MFVTLLLAGSGRGSGLVPMDFIVAASPLGASQLSGQVPASASPQDSPRAHVVPDRRTTKRERESEINGLKIGIALFPLVGGYALTFACRYIFTDSFRKPTPVIHTNVAR